MKLMNYSRDENFLRFRFENGLKELAKREFLNEELNLHLIQKHCHVNLQAVIEELKASQTSSCSRIADESSNATSAEKPISQQVSNHAETSIETVSESPWYGNHGSNIPCSIQSRPWRPWSPCEEAVTESESSPEAPARKKRKNDL